MIDTINKWSAIIGASHDPALYESGFLMIYVRFEKFLKESFVLFSTGSSYGSFAPSRKLQFSSEGQLLDVIRGESNFVAFPSSIVRCSKHVFSKDPFQLIFNDSNFSECIRESQFIRNHIAHRSVESFTKYNNSVLSAKSIAEYIEPGDYLAKHFAAKRKTYFSHYVDQLQIMHDVLKNDALLSGI